MRQEGERAAHALMGAVEEQVRGMRALLVASSAVLAFSEDQFARAASAVLSVLNPATRGDLV